MFELSTLHNSISKRQVIFRETLSWILLGNKNSMELTFGSTAHGAGRIMSRTQYHNKYNYKKIIEEIQSKGIILKSITHYGIVEASRSIQRCPYNSKYIT